ncbi:MAG TPA: coproporphyrinogen III oxidase, partial [Pseudomonadales bacterium]|nr:coproporphyrinogen III oxidase [Pseudomonadales bacterium]
ICRMSVDVEETGVRHGVDFRRHFAHEMRIIAGMEREGLLADEGNRICVTAAGRPLVRNICMVFDAYLDPSRQRFSRTI